MNKEFLKMKYKSGKANLELQEDMSINELLDRAIACEQNGKYAMQGNQGLFVDPEYWFQQSQQFFSLALILEQLQS